MYSIQTQWNQFEAACLKGLQPKQIREAKTVFYAGVLAIFRMQDAAAQTNPSEEDKFKIIEGWMSELAVFQNTHLHPPVARH
jgi:hypothetical protein